MSENSPLFAMLSDGKYEAVLIIINNNLLEFGSLSVTEQVYHIEALVSLKRFYEAIEYSKKYSESGNNHARLHFLHGLAFYCLGQYEAAMSHFSLDIQWSKWVKKAQIKDQICKGSLKPYTFSAESTKSDTNPVIEWYQATNYVTIGLLIKDVMKSQVDIAYYPFSVDITISDEHEIIYSSGFELYGEIIPQTCSYTISSQKLEIKMKKVVEQMWPCLSRPDPEESSAFSMASILRDINEMPIIDMDTAISNFEQQSVAKKINRKK